MVLPYFYAITKKQSYMYLFSCLISDAESSTHDRVTIIINVD